MASCIIRIVVLSVKSILGQGSVEPVEDIARDTKRRGARQREYMRKTERLRQNVKNVKVDCLEASADFVQLCTNFCIHCLAFPLPSLPSYTVQFSNGPFPIFLASGH